MSKLEKVEKAIEKGKEAALIKLAQDKDEEVRLAAIAGMGTMPLWISDMVSGSVSTIISQLMN